MISVPKPFCSKSLAVCCVLFHVNYTLLPNQSGSLHVQYVASNPIYGHFRNSVLINLEEINHDIFDSMLDEKVFAETYLDSFLLQFLSIILETTVYPKLESKIDCM